MGQLNIAVIGCGVCGGNHARVSRMLPDVKLAAVSDIDARKAQFVSGSYRTSGFTDTLRVLQDPILTSLSLWASKPMLVPSLSQHCHQHT